MKVKFFLLGVSLFISLGAKSQIIASADFALDQTSGALRMAASILCEEDQVDKEREEATFAE